MAYSIRFSVFIAFTFSIPVTPIFASQDEDDDELRSGLVASFSGADGRSFQRIDSTVSFVWENGAPDRRLGHKTYHVDWRGYLMSQGRGGYQLMAFVSGKLKIKLAGKTIIEGQAETPQWLQSQPMELEFDWHPLEINFQKTNEEARLSLFWIGPNFQIEPIGPRQFYHDPNDEPDSRFERGEQLVRALRCTACHDVPNELAAAPAAELSNLKGNIHHDWLVDWLENKEQKQTLRRMPSFALPEEEAKAISAFLLSKGQPPKRKPAIGDQKKGEQLLLTLGCLACHQVGSLGTAGLFGGGDLTEIAAKRPSDFFATWLSKPTETNRDHRMPVFQLDVKERNNLASHLSTLGRDKRTGGGADGNREVIERGQALFKENRCAACHSFHDQKITKRSKPLSAESNWEDSCLRKPNRSAKRPGYDLNEQDRHAVKDYLTAIAKTPRGKNSINAKQLIAERNCLSCHARAPAGGLAKHLPKIAASNPGLISQIPAMTPPPLDSVGDKLFDAALAKVISRTNRSRRDFLKVRMPKFNLSDDELEAMVKYFVDSDRIPDRPIKKRDMPSDTELLVAGSRLVTTNGFGCTSCHQVGDVIPPRAPRNARGADLTMLGTRIRRSWFERWVRNPARIVPRMEMPSIQLPVRGVLHENLEHQLAGVWHVLNVPEFQPPRPGPVHIVRRDSKEKFAAVLTDVINVGETSYIKPLLIGMPNGHSALFDLAAGRLAGWWTGDVARQHTKGKTWFWEPGGIDLLNSPGNEPELQILIDGETYKPVLRGQFITEADEWRHVDSGIQFEHQLTVRRAESESKETQTFRIQQRFLPKKDGFSRRVTIYGTEASARIQLRITNLAGQIAEVKDNELITKTMKVQLVDSPAVFDKRGYAISKFGGNMTFNLEYTTSLSLPPVPTPPIIAHEQEVAKPERLDVVPGFETTRLALDGRIMPTGLAWQPDGALIVTSLRGGVWLARDTDGDELEDKLQRFSDELAAPYGAAGYGKHIDVINKTALLRLSDDDGDGFAERTETIASGWGHTKDYHDWVVGLPSDEDGNYYVAIPCQQDDRSQAAARYRGKVLKLVPREPTPEDPRVFAIERVSGGHRFPMGIARNRQGEMFVTDNQGNYNPFNELNHVLQDARYGFINKLERTADFKPSLTPPVVDIPHPWTRSVNGICFLDTPDNLYGPFEGHLIGCEYDTRRLIRMSLQKVGDTYQGAAYPFSYDRPPDGRPLLGPIVCSIAPDGDLYIGNMRDSGWGGANNTGTVARIRPLLDELPAGIAEVRATSGGLLIEFTAPVEPEPASDVENYSVSSYTRQSTPAYGGNDVDRRVETIRDVQLAEDNQSVLLAFDEMRVGYVYELRLKDLTNGKTFFPAEAHYTLRTIPEPVNEE